MKESYKHYLGKKISGKINDYYIDEYIGGGGNGYVFKAHDLNSKIYSIKVLHSYSKSKQKNYERFKNEYYYQGSTKCVYIVKTIDEGWTQSEKSKPFYVMPFYDSNFRELMNNKNIQPGQYIKYILQLCKALKEIHKIGIVHRDIKPENILYEKKNDKVLLGDFGIAHFPNKNMTLNNEKMCNFDYHAPEQCINGSKQYGPYTDIYSLGLIINEIFTSEIPYGDNYLKINDVNPIYGFLDNIVSTMLISQIEARENNIEVIYNKILLDNDEVIEEIEYIGENLGIDTNSTRYKKIRKIAISDILLANRLLLDSKLEWGKINLNYHKSISYNTDKILLDSLIILEIFNCLNKKLMYEGKKYIDESIPYESLNIDLEEDRKLYKSFVNILNQYKTFNFINDYANCSKKIFLSLSYFHGREIIDEVKRVIDEVSYACVNSPILWISYQVSKHYNKLAIDRNFDLSLYLKINKEKKYEEINKDIIYLDNNYINEIQRKLNDIFVNATIDSKYRLVFSDKNDLNIFEDKLNIYKETLFKESCDYLDLLELEKLKTKKRTMHIFQLDDFYLNIVSKIINM